MSHPRALGLLLEGNELIARMPLSPPVYSTKAARSHPAILPITPKAHRSRMERMPRTPCARALAFVDTSEHPGGRTFARGGGCRRHLVPERSHVERMANTSEADRSHIEVMANLSKTDRSRVGMFSLCLLREVARQVVASGRGAQRPRHRRACHAFGRNSRRRVHRGLLAGLCLLRFHPRVPLGNGRGC